MVILASSLGLGALLDDCGGKVRVEENLEFRVTCYPKRLDGVELAKSGCGFGGVLGSRILTQPVSIEFVKMELTNRHLTDWRLSPVETLSLWVVSKEV